MKLLSARVKGLKGIFSKSGIKEVSIDFTKCISNIIYIIGKNGSGKSTLLSVLHPLPDPASMFLDHEEGEEELVYDKNGVLYRILIKYPINPNGTRATTKAFITKTTSDGNTLELNANGTVGSYKDILFSEFCLDPNFISLSHLSVEDRGIVEKPPRERKKLVSNLLESIEVYNDIYKTLVKRSSVFNAMVSSITSKIDSIGDESTLLMNKAAGDNRLKVLQEKKSSLEHQIALSAAAIKVIDPTGEIQLKYNTLFNNLNVITDNIKMISASIPQTVDCLTLEDATSKYLELKKLEATLQGNIDAIKDNISLTMSKRAEDANMITAKSQKLASITSEQNAEDLVKLINAHKEKIANCEELFKKLNLSGDILTTDEFKLGISVFNYIRDAISNIRSYSEESHIESACGDLDIEYELSILNDSLEKSRKEKDAIERAITKYKELERIASILDNRPDSCTIDTCKFISEAISARSTNPTKVISDFETRLVYVEDNIAKQEKDINELNIIRDIQNKINRIIEYINSNEFIIKKFPFGDRYIYKTVIMDRIRLGDPFNEVTTLSQYAGQAALFEEYKDAKQILFKLESQYELAKTQESIIDDLQQEINDLSTKLADIDKYINDKNAEIGNINNELKKCIDEIEDINNIINAYRKLEKLETDKAEIESQLKIVSENIDKISKEVAANNKAQSELDPIMSEINTLLQSQNQITYSLNKLVEYKTELDAYNTKKNTIELIKKYSSPTKGGIQTIFMQLYMDKTLSLSNEILSMMFDNTLELLPYVINENEFRIPVKNNITNLIVDDISNCSTSEKSMIAMIMSFVLGFHGSREYNIIRLDEIDGGLDQYNRSIFPMTLYKIMTMLHIEQCFIISHSSETDLSNADIISLTPVSNETIHGNVIFQL